LPLSSRRVENHLDEHTHIDRLGDVLVVPGGECVFAVVSAGSG
jgi:hypothetical protein